MVGVLKIDQKTQLIESVTKSFADSGSESVALVESHYVEHRAAGAGHAIVLVITLIANSIPIAQGIVSLFRRKEPPQKVRIKIGSSSVFINSKMSADEIVKIIAQLQKSQENTE